MSHLLFADDSLLLLKADCDNASELNVSLTGMKNTVDKLSIGIRAVCFSARIVIICRS